MSDSAIDNVLVEIGIGRFQLLNFMFICIPIVFIVNAGTVYVFTARDLKYRCAVAECDSGDSSVDEYDSDWVAKGIPLEDGEVNKCERYKSINETCGFFNEQETVSCESYVYGEEDSIVKGLDIPCQDWKRSLVATANSAGQLVSLLFSGFLSDKYGRRIVMVIMTLSGGVIGCIQSFSSSYWMFVILEFLNLAVSAGAYGAIYIMMVESLPTKYRIYGCALIETFVTLSIALVGLFAWVAHSWKWLILFANIPMFIVILSYFITPESIRWLYAKGKEKQCMLVLESAAKMNGITISTDSLAYLKESINMDDKTEDVSESITKSRVLLIRLTICSFCWFASVLTYNGLTINSVNITTNLNIYLDFAIVSLVEIPSIVVYLLILRFIGRKIGLFVSLFFGGVFCIVYSLIPTLPIYLTAKFFITISFILLYIYTTEIFPTSLRNSTMSVCSILGRVGGMVAPQILLLESYDKTLPMIILGVLPILSTVVIWKMPETRNVKLPDTIEEAEQLT